MVFTPIRGAPSDPADAELVLDAQLTAKEQRGKRIVHPAKKVGRRLAWRAVVRTQNRETVVTEWHLAACSDSAGLEAHCPEGRRLIQAIGDPEGHCLVNGGCPLCDSSISPASELTL